ncbi:putative endonuclease [Mucilaginibacter gracilis]|jgi:putative endonuclease|uniref:Putative endonuclease n=1 Tax=Mucilaginibacter gracilis TaxID=423350 RepID=A0A495J583_9SPHI|nr:GIY-YIG nuclease family protein [Mucilaginibacter gracilis]RKR83913.1 putative endonuclease [Mucilaginibacter gracilis]
MNTFIYIITDRNRNCLHTGTSTDLIKTLDFYTEMPNLFFDSAQQLNRLVYFEEITNEEMAMERFKVLSRFTRAQKEKMIRSVNPDWVDLTIGLKFEANAMQRTAFRPSIAGGRKRVSSF